MDQTADRLITVAACGLMETVVCVSSGHGGVLPRKRGRLRQTRGQPEPRRALHHLHLLPQQELEPQGAFRDL